MERDPSWAEIQEVLRSFMKNIKKLQLTFSGLCAPGPGFIAVSEGILYLEAIENTGGFLSM